MKCPEGWQEWRFWRWLALSLLLVWFATHTTACVSPRQLRADALTVLDVAYTLERKHCTEPDLTPLEHEHCKALRERLSGPALRIEDADEYWRRAAEWSWDRAKPHVDRIGARLLELAWGWVEGRLTTATQTPNQSP